VRRNFTAGEGHCFPAEDDATFRAIEVQLAGKTLEEHFREQAELIDQRFAEYGEKWERRFSRLERDVTGLKVDVGTLKADVTTLKKDMVIVREGISILLKKHS
jgi:hypothetical protein